MARLRRSYGAVVIVLVSVACLAAQPQSERTWTDSTGRHTVRATLLDFQDGRVTLRRSDGKSITLAIEKLSDQDQDYVRQWEKDSQSPAKPDETPIKDVARRFFVLLRSGNRDALRELLSPEARAAYDKPDSPFRQLPSPDRSTAIRVGSVNVEQDRATVQVHVRLRGRNQQLELRLRQHTNKWLVSGITGPGKDGQELTLNFDTPKDQAASDAANQDIRDDETAEGEDRESEATEGEGASAADDTADLLAIPAGGLEEQLAFIERLMGSPPSAPGKNAAEQAS